MILGVAHTDPGFDPPQGACDCHTHVFGPPDRFPFAPDRVYTPGVAAVESLAALHHALRLDRAVIVQPSPYGADNSCTVDGLQRLWKEFGRQARAIAVIDRRTSDAELRALHDAGVRGVRVNLETSGVHDPAAARVLLEEAAARVAPLGWHVQTFTSLPVIAALRDVLARLPVPLVIDHFGRAQGALGPAQPGFDALLELVGSGQAYVKISAAYRISEQPDHADVAPLARALIDANPDRVVWGTDWPHPGGHRRAPHERDEIEPFRPEDDGRALNRLQTWAPDAAVLRRILVDNPARLYDF